MEKIILDVIVIGGGPAGLTAALYTARGGLRTLLIVGESTVSQITATDLIENYPGFPAGISGYELLEKFQQQAKSLGVEMLNQDVLSIKRRGGDANSRLGNNGNQGWEVAVGFADNDAGADTASDSTAINNNTYLSHTLIIATGTIWRRLSVEGEEAFIGKGVSFCATCDGPLYRGKEVVVVGGGDAAVQEALFLANFVSKVTLIHRRDRLRAADILQQRARENSKIKFIWNAELVTIKGEKTVTSIIVKDVRSSKMREIPTSGVFVFIGLVPNTGFLKDTLELSPNGAIVVDRRLHTSASGIFAAGDCTEKSLRQVITACGDGALAAQQAQHFVEELKGASYPPSPSSPLRSQTQ